MRKYLEEKTKSLNPNRIEKIRGEASTRAFFRLFFDNYSLIAMVYPGENREEIARIIRLTELYREHGICVPAVKEVIDDRIILQEDLGDLLIQGYYTKASREEKKSLLRETAVILGKLHRISAANTRAVLGHERLKWEMDFFLQHFVGNFWASVVDAAELREKLYALVERIGNITCFAHRDFHSRNMLYHKEKIYLVDFQDSLVASPYYDLVSFAFDCYLDLMPKALPAAKRLIAPPREWGLKSLREYLFSEYEKQGLPLDLEQLYLSALQRNIKALGTFGFQVFERKNLTYKKYIRRTLRFIINNELFGDFLDSTVFPAAIPREQ
ncbi:MAG: phosphotransferase [Candidatus Aminicenantes bacterium]|nr:phosphotransferase [Candidatus Aminicenantes bacterium]